MVHTAPLQIAHSLTYYRQRMLSLTLLVIVEEAVRHQEVHMLRLQIHHSLTQYTL